MLPINTKIQVKFCSHSEKILKFFLANQSITITANNKPPTVAINSPTTNGVLYLFDSGELIQFAATVTDESIATLSYRWELQIVHLNHIHTDQKIVTTNSFAMNVSKEGADSHGSERIDYRVELTVTDAMGLVAKDSILLADKNFLTKFGGNTAPVPSFIIDGKQRSESPVRLT